MGEVGIKGILASRRALCSGRSWFSRLEEGFFHWVKQVQVCPCPSQRKLELCTQESDLPAPVMPTAASLCPQVPGSKGIHELQSSTKALRCTLEESAALLAMFWRAALPSYPSPTLPGQAVRGQRPLLVLPQMSFCLLSPVGPADQELNGERGRRALEGGLSSSVAALQKLYVPSSPTQLPGRQNQGGKGKDMQKAGQENPGHT